MGKHILSLSISILIIFSLFGSVQAKDEWIKVSSKNFLLLGNASEKEIKKVGTRLEQFRETFRLLFTRTNFSSPVPTTVFVFKSNSAYKNFKPKRSDGKIDEFVAGYFQPGDDVNYITLSTEGEDEDMFGTIFHEYVHFIVNTNYGKSEVPPWFNEGLAEYYQTFSILDDQKVKLGLPQSEHINLLRNSKFIPLDQLFRVSNYQLTESGNHSRSIFYAESWALIHYLLQSGKAEAMSNFLASMLKDVPPDKAFEDAFKVTYAQMEADLRKYVGNDRYQYNQISFKEKLTFEGSMTTQPLPEADTNAYLGDLLYHIQRPDDAEPYLLNAVKLAPDSSMANTSLGMVKIRQRKYDDARTWLEKAVAADQKSPMAYYWYAYLMSREGRDDFGYVKSFSAETANKIRTALGKAIAVNPTFTESYELLAFVDLVNNEQLDLAVDALKKALKYQPGNQRYAMRIGEILARQKKYDEAMSIAEKISKTADDAELKTRGDTLAAEVQELRKYDEQRAAFEKQNSGSTRSGGLPVLRKTTGEKTMTEAEIAKIQAEATLRSINENLRKVNTGETRTMGHVESISCRPMPVAYAIKTPTETFKLSSKDFNSLTLNVLTAEANNLEIGCDAKVSAFNAVITYRQNPAAKGPIRGELLAIEFVPDDFRILTDEEMAKPATRIIYADRPATESSTSRDMPVSDDTDKMRRDSIFAQIRSSIRLPAEGEKREIGFLDSIECTSKGNFFRLKTNSGVLRLAASKPAIRIMMADLEGLKFDCTLKPIEFPAIFVYKVATDPKSKTAGELLTLDFVPKGFVLEP